MREWSLGPGDPLTLNLAADFRFCIPDYANDHIWELETGGGDPPEWPARLRPRIFPPATIPASLLQQLSFP